MPMMIDKLTLSYNRARQTAITQELLRSSMEPRPWKDKEGGNPLLNTGKVAQVIGPVVDVNLKTNCRRFTTPWR